MAVWVLVVHPSLRHPFRVVPCPVVVSVVVLAALAFAPAHGLSSTLNLDPIPDRSYTGDKVTFTGTLTGGGQALPGRVVWICEDDPLWPDDCLASGTTNGAGRFHIEWTVRDGAVETDFDIYAEFNGDSRYDSDQTPRQEMSVYELRGGRLVLDPVQDSAWFGEAVEMSGTLYLEGRSPEGAVVYIKDEDTFNPDDLLASAYVDASGRFTTYWIAQDVDPTNTIEIQAVFEKDSSHRRLATGIQKLSMTEPPRPLSTPVGGDGYMELYYSLSFDRAPRVLIVTTQDSYESVRKHIAPVQEGISLLSSMLEREYAYGDWNVEFEVVAPGGRAGFEPDIFVNLVTRQDDAECGVDYAGWADVSGKRPVQTVVCSLDTSTNADIMSTTMHEIIHAIGVGHTFNIPNDLLCSVEPGYGDTCPGTYNKSDLPSELNLAAVAAVYGTNGFQNPNNNITRNEKFTLNGYQSGGPVILRPGQDVADETVQASAVTVDMHEGAFFPTCADANDCFVPHTVTVGTGTGVTWTNNDTVLHTVTELGGLFDSWLLPGEEFAFMFDTPGSYTYGCMVHPWASGVVVVEAVEDSTTTHVPETTRLISETMYTDFEEYGAGEVVLVDGIFLEVYEGETLVLSMTGQNGDLISWVPVLVEDGRFAEFFYATGAGAFHILLHDEHDLVASTSFDVAGRTDAVVFTDCSYCGPGATVLIDGFYWGSYDGPSSMVVFGPDWDVAGWIDVDVVGGFFETRTTGYHLPGRHVVDMYDEWGTLVASTAFMVEP